MIAETSYHSYPKVHALGHRGIAEILQEPVIVEEKIDGSQFSFGVFNGELKCRSKGQQIVVDAPEKLFNHAVATAIELAPVLHDGWTYRAEYLQKPKHNTINYARVPAKHLIVFDINTGHEHYMTREEKEAEAARVGLEFVPCFFQGMIESLDQLREFMDSESILGNEKIEGVVIKNYARFSLDGKVMIGKVVRDGFHERNCAEFRKANPKSKDIVSNLIDVYRTEARWEKAAQHIAESGKLEGDPRDIGALLKEAQRDTLDECRDEIKDALFQWAWPQIQRGIVAGLPEWYKAKLLAEQFGETTA